MLLDIFIQELCVTAATLVHLEEGDALKHSAGPSHIRTLHSLGMPWSQVFSEIFLFHHEGFSHLL